MILRNFSNHHIDVEVHEENGDVKCHLTGFYGYLEERLQNSMWNLLRGLGQVSKFPWIVVGDFNEIAFSYEKFGCRARDEK